MISGGFFAIVATALVRWSGNGHALVAGTLVGGAMFVANAVALCIVHSISHTLDAAVPRQRVYHAREMHAS